MFEPSKKTSDAHPGPFAWGSALRPLGPALARSRDVRRAILVMMLVVAAGCRSERLSAEGEHSKKAAILAVPLAGEAGSGDGGVACAGLLLRYHGTDLDLEAQTRFPPESAGAVTATELRDYFRGRGFASELLGGDLSAELPRGLFAYIERGYPAILAFEDRFVLAYGFDPVAQLVYVADPLTGRRELGYEALERLWRPTGRLLLAAVPARF